MDENPFNSLQKLDEFRDIKRNTEIIMEYIKEDREKRSELMQEIKELKQAIKSIKK